jgi:hypothetical protein
MSSASDQLFVSATSSSAHLIDQPEGLLRRELPAIATVNGIRAAVHAGQGAGARHFPDHEKRRAIEVRKRDGDDVMMSASSLFA